jgi:hypothetical protein
MRLECGSGIQLAHKPGNGRSINLRPGHTGAPDPLTVSLDRCNRAWKLPSCVEINQSPASMEVTRSTAAE